MSSFICWLLYLFWLELKFKEHWFRVYRFQWNNSIPYLLRFLLKNYVSGFLCQIVLKTGILHLLVVNIFIWCFLFFFVQTSNLRNSRFVFIGANGLFWLSSLKKCFISFTLLIISEGKTCGIGSTKGFDGKMFVQVLILFQI